MARTKKTRPFLVACLAWGIAAFLALKLGAVSDADFNLILQLRLPRVLIAAAVGVGLAVSGTVLQALFSNPLCDPYTLGISSGSALGAVIGTSLGLQWLVSGLAGSAFAGALVFVCILTLISFRTVGTSLSLLLAGVMLGFLGSSLVALWAAVADTNGIQGSLFWLLGDLSRARFSGALFAGLSVTGLSIILWSHSSELDAFLMGEEDAIALGVNVRKARRRMIFLTSLLVGVCVSAAGMIGFIGLVIPHLARRQVGSLHRLLIPLAAIWGAASLTAADGLARIIARPYEVPVGIVTALIGAPIFLWLIMRKSAVKREVPV